MGAAESASKGEATGTAPTASDELQKTIKEKDARIKELSVSVEVLLKRDTCADIVFLRMPCCTERPICRTCKGGQ